MGRKKALKRTVEEMETAEPSEANLMPQVLCLKISERLDVLAYACAGSLNS